MLLCSLSMVTLLSDETLTSSKNYGTGLLFSGGKVQDIKWSQKKNSEVKFTDPKWEVQFH